LNYTSINKHLSIAGQRDEKQQEPHSIN